ETRLAPHPRLVARAMFERQPVAGELFDTLVQVVTLEIDCSGGNDLLFGVDLDGQRRSAASFEPRVIGRIVDDLFEAELLVGADRPLVIRAGDGDLIEAKLRSGVEANLLLADRAAPQPKAWRFEQ